MPFDLTKWKTTVRERLVNWRQRMQGFGVDSVYASLYTNYDVVAGGGSSERR